MIATSKSAPKDKELFFGIVDKCLEAERFFPANSIWTAYVKQNGRTASPTLLPGNSPTEYAKFQEANNWRKNWQDMSLAEVVDAANNC